MPADDYYCLELLAAEMTSVRHAREQCSFDLQSISNILNSAYRRYLNTGDLVFPGIYIWCNDVTASMVTIRSPFCGWYNVARCVELMGEDLPCYSNKI